MRRPSCVPRVARKAFSATSFCFFVVFVCHCLLLLVSADVAVLSTRLAIISMREEECLAGGDLQWRVRLPGFATKVLHCDGMQSGVHPTVTGLHCKETPSLSDPDTVPIWLSGERSCLCWPKVAREENLHS